MVKVALYVLFIVAAVKIASAVPFNDANPLKGLRDVKFSKRMNTPLHESPHDSSCVCIDCFAKATDMVPVEEGKSSDFISNPCLQVICCPIMTIADLITAPINRAHREAKVANLEMMHRWWLERNKINPDKVKVILKKNSSSSTTSMMPSLSRQKAMSVPPRISIPMAKQKNGNDIEAGDNSRQTGTATRRVTIQLIDRQRKETRLEK